MMQEKDDEEREDEFRNRVTNMPDASHATPSTVYSKRKLHPREAVSGNPLKYEPTNLACDIAAVLLAAQKRGSATLFCWHTTWAGRVSIFRSWKERLCSQ